MFVGDDWPEHKVDPDTNMRGSRYDGRVLWLVMVVPAVAQYSIEYYIDSYSAVDILCML